MSKDEPVVAPKPKRYTIMRGDKGWALIPPTRRFHFYDEAGMSLCRTRQTLAVPDEAFTPPSGTEKPGPGDCAKCWHALNHRPVEPS